jgi:penicillin-binding protein A
MAEEPRPPENWREYQRSLQRDARRKSLFRRVPALAFSISGLALLAFLVIYGGNRILVHFSEASYPQPEKEYHPVSKVEAIDTEELWPLMSARFGEKGNVPDCFPIDTNDSRLMVQTSIVPELQKYIYHILERSQTKKAAVVVLRPHDGRVLAMASYRENGKEGDNLCLASRFPAASLFKIVSAAAAIEKAHYTPDRALNFLGRAHTLYRNQLTKKVNRYSTKVTFRKAFANSINPVFGKLGIYTLGRKTIVDYAQKFFFNRPIFFDLPISPSVIDVPEDPYSIAEIASGFNKRTLISPFHAALLACAVANGGKVMKPWVVKEIKRDEAPVYEAHPGVLGVPITSKTARYLQAMMEDTVRYGTCRKSFWRLRRKKRFREFNLGAKTGTINDPSDVYKYDWITAFAMRKDNSDGICVAVLEVHGRKLGIRSREIARAIINYNIRS